MVTAIVLLCDWAKEVCVCVGVVGGCWCSRHAALRPQARVPPQQGIMYARPQVEDAALQGRGMLLPREHFGLPD